MMSSALGHHSGRSADVHMHVLARSVMDFVHLVLRAGDLVSSEGLLWKCSYSLRSGSGECCQWSGVLRAPLGSEEDFGRLEGDTSNAPKVVGVVLELCMLLMLPKDQVTWKYHLLLASIHTGGNPLFDKERSTPTMRLWRNRLETVS
jgi:hypothetical protein